MTRFLVTLTCIAFLVVVADAQKLLTWEEANPLVRIARWSDSPSEVDERWDVRPDGIRFSVGLRMTKIDDASKALGDYNAWLRGMGATPDASVQSGIAEVTEPAGFGKFREASAIPHDDAPRFLPFARDVWTTLRHLIAAAAAAHGASVTGGGRNGAADRHDVLQARRAPGQQAQPAATVGAPLPRLRMLFVSLGASTGEAFHAEIINDGPEVITIEAMRLVLEPLSAEDARHAAAAIRALRAKRPMTARVTGYCLDFAKKTPASGTIFRVAPLETQQQSEPVRRILHASRTLRAAGMFTPDSDPTRYFHSIRQWAIWTLAQKFTLDSFTRAYIEHTKKIAQGAGRAWSAEAEDVLRKAAPGRWRDIEQILREADRLRTAVE